MKWLKNKISLEDRRFMKMALRLACKGRGHVSPNPPVGAVVVRQGRVVGRGAHMCFGGPHAEAAALREARRQAQGATLYITLEPCSTYGKTPPCTEAIVQSGVRRVVAAMVDPNPKHKGKGIAFLRSKGIRVDVGLEEKGARELLLPFKKWITSRIPYVIVKEAMSLDGKIATRTQDSQWLSGLKSRRWAHDLRNQADAILIGKRTALKDNPRLTIRLGRRNGFQPWRLVVSKDAKLPFNLKLFSPALRGKTLLVAGTCAPEKRLELWRRRGVGVVAVPTRNGAISIQHLLKKLGRLGVTSLLVEGGGETVGAFFEARAVDRLYLLVAPQIIGGAEAPTPVEGVGVSRLADALKARQWNWKKSGKDLLIEAQF